MAYSRTLNHFTSMQELATIWASSTSYVVNQLVINSDKLYRCLIAHTSTASFATDLGAGNWVEVSASASGVKNYITNGNFENSSTSGWNLARSTLDATTKLPNQASGSWTAAAGTLSRTIVTSGQLSGVASLSLASSAATTAGDMLVTDALTLDLEAQASVQTFSFYYRVTSGASNGNFSGTSSNSIGVAIYVVDGALAGTWIQPAGVWSVNTASSVAAVTAKAAGTFQVPSDATQVRLAVYFPNASTGAITVYLDDFVLGPQVVQYGAPVTDTQNMGAITIGATTTAPTKGGTRSVDRVLMRRVGDSAELVYEYAQSTAGTAGTGTYLFSLPSGFSFDTGKVTTSGGLIQSGRAGAVSSIGYGQLQWNSATGYNANLELFAYSSNQFYAIVTSSQTSAGAGGSEVDEGWGTNFAFSDSSVGFRLFLRTPILGWSSSVQMSNDTDTRVVDFSINPTSGITPTGTIALAFSSCTTVNWNTTPTKDSHGIYSNGVITIPVAGDYSCSAKFETQGTGGTFWEICYVVNGTQVAETPSKPTANNQYIAGSVLIPNLKAGDLLTIRLRTDCTSPVFVSSIVNSLSLFRLSGPSAIAASEQIAASYWASANGTASTTAPFNFDSKEFDSHGTVTTGVSWRFTAPRSDWYTVGFVGNQTAGTNVYITLYKNGSAYKLINYGPATPGFNLACSTLVQLNAGDYIDIRPSTSLNYAGGALSANASSNVWIRSR